MQTSKLEQSVMSNGRVGTEEEPIFGIFDMDSYEDEDTIGFIDPDFDHGDRMSTLDDIMFL